MPNAPRILVVNNDADTVWLYCLMLEQAGYQTVAALGGMDAIELLQDEAVDLVLMDTLMPDLTGIEVCQRIRQFSDVPIVFVSNLADPKTVKRAYESGANEYHPTPITPQKLQTIIHGYLPTMD